MNNKKLEEYSKGDIGFEILIEKSSESNGITITLWMNEKGKFQVGYHKSGAEMKAMREFKQYKNVFEAWQEYVDCCKSIGCSP